MSLDLYLAAALAAATWAEVETLFKELVAEDGFDAVACGSVVHTTATVPPLFFFNSWPRRWIELYAERSFLYHDPAVNTASRRMAPFTFTEAIDEAPETPGKRELLNAFHDFGWVEGFAVPIHGPGGYFGLVTMAGRKSATDLTPPVRARLHMAAFAAHERCRRIGAPAVGAGSPERLTPREFECMRLVAAGRTDRDVADALGISMATARFHIDGARRKLNAETRSHAVAILVRIGLL